MGERGKEIVQSDIGIVKIWPQKPLDVFFKKTYSFLFLLKQNYEFESVKTEIVRLRVCWQINEIKNCRRITKRQ